MDDGVIAWIGANLLPFEGEVRRWLRRARTARDHEDDIVQDAYCRIGAAQDLSHIRNGRAYFYTVVRSILIERFRREKIIKFESLAEIESLHVIDESPSAERVLSGQQQYEMVRRLIDGLPDRCREVFTMRKVHQLSQKDTAERLGISENIVEKEVARGMKLLMQAVAEMDAGARQQEEMKR
jgi:RNA polymerase sigma factor (sigma-70 family)